MAQFVRPIADLDNTGGWTTTPLWSDIDDGASPDGVVILSDTNPIAAESFTVDGSTVTDPAVATGHIIRGHWAKNATDGSNYTLSCEVRQGYVSEASPGTLIATLTSPAISGDTLQTDTYTLSAGEANSITDYSDLQLRSFATKSGGGATRAVKIDYIELQVPDAGLALVKLRDETVTVSEGSIRLLNLIRAKAETVATAESTPRLMAQVRARAETVTIPEAGGGLHNEPYTEPLRNLVFVRLLAETVAMSEGSVRLLNLIRAKADTVTGLEGGKAYLTEPYTEALRNLVYLRLRNETVAIPEAGGGLHNEPYTEPLRNLTFVRLLNEAEAITEVLVKLLEGAGAALVKVWDETVTVADAALRNLVYVRLRTETVATTETTPRTRSLVRLLAETVTTVEGLVRSRGLVRLLGETVQATETIVRVLAKELVRVITETVTTLEAGVAWVTGEAMRVFTYGRIVDETVETAEGILRTALANVLLRSETVTVDETGGEVRITWLRVLQETVGLLEDGVAWLTEVTREAFRTMALRRLTGETVQTSEGVLRLGPYVRVIAETVTVAETTVRLVEALLGVNLVKVWDETVQATENTVRLLTLLHARDETVSITEVPFRVGIYLRLIAETVNAAETALQRGSWLRVFNETLAVQEVAGRRLITASATFVRLIGETVVSSETTLRIFSFQPIVDELLEVSEAPARVGVYVRVIAETVTLAEIVVSPFIVFGLRFSATLTAFVADVQTLTARVLFKKTITGKTKDEDTI